MLKKKMTRWTNTFLTITVLASTFLHGQSDTIYFGDKTGFSFQSNDTTFYYKHSHLISISIKLSNNRFKGIGYYKSGKIESISYSRPSKDKNGYESVRSSIGYYENGVVRYKAKKRKGHTRGNSYIYYPNGNVQCKTYWNKLSKKKRQICYDEQGNKTNVVKTFGTNDVRIDECNCDYGK